MRLGLISFGVVLWFAMALRAESPPAATLALPSPPTANGQRALPIDLKTALELANARPLDIQIANQQVAAAIARYDRSKYRWLPSISVGGDYFHHNGAVQNFQGDVVRQARTSAMGGVGANATIGLSDSLFAPLAARQEMKAQRATLKAVGNDVALSVAEAYFNVQQSRGDLAGSLMLVSEAEEIARRTEQLAEGLAPPLEANRTRVELARRKQAASTARERWRNSSAELARLLRLDAAAAIEPIEPTNMPIPLIDSNFTLDDLIPVALLTRPELQANQALVKATLQRLRQEKLRPLVPSVLIRSVSTNPSGSLAYGTFGGGTGGKLGNSATRFDYDIQLVWEFENFGLGNRARAAERKAEHETAILELFRTQDRIASEVAKAFAEATAAAERLAEAEPALREATDSLKKNMEAMTQTRRIGNLNTLLVRPQEVVAAVQALAQANSDYFGAVGDYNRSQFRLYRALGHPAECLPALAPAATLGSPARK